jgi:hypothetical protein
LNGTVADELASCQSTCTKAPSLTRVISLR